VEIVEGLQVPKMLLLEVVGKFDGVAFWQYGPTAVNVGVVGAITVILIVLVVEQVGEADDVGVNV
jgi:hypothetical protein